MLLTVYFAILSEHIARVRDRHAVGQEHRMRALCVADRLRALCELCDESTFFPLLSRRLIGCCLFSTHLLCITHSLLTNIAPLCNLQLNFDLLFANQAVSKLVCL